MIPLLHKMNYFRKYNIVLFVLLIASYVNAQSNKQNTYLIVHGAWGGGWAFKAVDSMLTSTGAKVYRPTLTGQGERVHLASTAVGLETHINDIVNTILFEELDQVILIGHSYAGMVITGVADRLPDRINKLVYMDALVPEHGESAEMIMGALGGHLQVIDGHIIPPWVKEGTLPPKDVPHPAKTWSDKIELKNTSRLKIPSYYILTVEEGTSPEQDDFASQAKRAKEKNWTVRQLQADHNPQWSTPKELVQLFLEIAK